MSAYDPAEVLRARRPRPVVHLRAERDEAVAEVERLRYALRVAHAHWDADRDVKVGKTLILALRGEPVPSAPEVPAPTSTPRED